MMKVINLTPHVINVFRAGAAGVEEIVSIPPSGKIARLEVSRKETANLTEINGETVGNPHDGFGGVSLQVSQFGDPALIENGGVVPFPAQEQDTLYIVSSLFRSGFDRPDLWTPGEYLRNGEGQPIGCLGLSR